MRISGPVLMTDDVFTMYYAALRDYGRVPLEWRVGQSYWSALRNLKAADGAYLWKPGIGTASPVTLMGCPIRLVDEDVIECVPSAVTGPTQRLEVSNCGECGDETPRGARFCIACGAPVQ